MAHNRDVNQMRQRPAATAAMGAALLTFVVAACGSTSPAHDPSAPAGQSAPTLTAPPASTTLPAAPVTTTTTLLSGPNLREGSTGPRVLRLQTRLTALGYWLGTPNGTFGDSTEQAVYAFQKAAGLTRDGVVGPKTAAALATGAVPHPRSTSGYVIEIDLSDDLMMFVTNGKLDHILNTSTGGSYLYTVGKATGVADTPVGVFHISRQVDGMVTDSLGQLWRPKFFYGGFAIHGDGYVPPYPVSHGCARVSNEAIDWIWADQEAPIGTEVWVY
jgi:peptidoglycan hydrolase-like protein with peptidoglycan-binding domain